MEQLGIDNIIAQRYAAMNIEIKTMFYPLTFDFSINSTLNDVINIKANYDFIIVSTAYWQDDASAQTDATRELSDVTVQITDTNSGEDFFSEPVYVNSLFGTGQFPYIWPQPRLVLGTSSLKIVAQIFDSSTPKMQLAFQGVHILNRGPSGPNQ